ncbi:MAG: SulP family inorganic anion transporter [Pseudohongiellaceae bacterium]
MQWLRQYDKDQFTDDLVAAVIVTIMLVPQSLAYALLAGVPAEVGLYASILPLVFYMVFGSSRTLAVGPVAVVSLMTASSIGSMGLATQAEYLQAAVILALLSGIFLVLLGILRFGFLANFLSHPVVAGFITASAIIIAVGQVRHILGIQAGGDNLPEQLTSLLEGLPETSTETLWVGGFALVFLTAARLWLKQGLDRLGVPAFAAGIIVKAAPVIAVIITIAWAGLADLGSAGVALVGAIPAGLPNLALPGIDRTMVQELALPAILISVIGYVESVSVGKTLAAKRRQKINQNQELIGLGAANIGSALSGGFPVTGGFSRSVVNYDAGARTPAAGLFTAIGIGVATMTLTGYLALLPKATLAATIIIAVLGLVDFSILKKTWVYSRSDFIAVAATIVVTLLAGVETGVSTGVAASLVLHLYKTSRPHIAEVGEIKGTKHFRNVKRHQVETFLTILQLRVDESLYFANATHLEEEIFRNLNERPQLEHIILMCNAVNEIDISALEVLESMNEILKEQGVGFHLSEVKGPVMDHLEGTHFLAALNGQVFLSHYQAVQTLVLEDTLLSL